MMATGSGYLASIVHRGAAVTAAVLMTAPMCAAASGGNPEVLSHGCSIFKKCTGPKCVGSRVDCTIRITYNDEVGDTTRIVSCFDLINPGRDQVRIPAQGNLYIVEVGGNTTAKVGDQLPVLIGPGGSVNSGLPGHPANGFVVFAATPAVIDEEHPDLAYTILPTDPDPLLDQAQASWQDLCDVQPVGCSPLVNTMQNSSATPLIHPGTEVKVTPNPATICVGTGTEVTYSYTVKNIGDAVLSNVSVKDDACSTVQYKSGDTDGDNKLDLEEDWLFTCTRVVALPTTNTATVNAESPDPHCPVMASGQATVTANPECCTGDILLNGFVNLDDLLEVINSWGACPPPCLLVCPADIDHNCFINADDLLAVINRWGPCP